MKKLAIAAAAISCCIANAMPAKARHCLLQTVLFHQPGNNVLKFCDSGS